MKLRLPITTVLMMGLLLSACSESSNKQAENEQAVSASQNASPEPLLKNVDSEGIQDVITSYKGDKAVLVNVWATWCVPCVEEFPEIVDIQEKYADNLQVIFISADFPEDRDRAVQFLKDHHVNWTTYFKDDKDEPFINAISQEWSGALPFTKVINMEGEEVAHWENKASFDIFDKHVQQAIKP